MSDANPGDANAGAPFRRPLAWQDPAFDDPEKLDAEFRRVFDICHGCRRCFNLCDSFPRLFDLIDATPSEVIEEVASSDFKSVVDACTLCDMCFMTKCPYVPPHPFDLDFPHLMLRYRAMEFRAGKTGFADRALTETDRNGRLGGAVAPLANWATATGNRLSRPVMEKVADIHRDAALPKFHGKTFVARAREPATVNAKAPGFGRKAVLYATCFVNYHNPGIGEAARKILAHNGVETEVVHPICCGMPKLEQGDIQTVVDRARKISAELLGWRDKGYDVVALIPSCALMIKSEWPLMLPDDAEIKRLAECTFDLSQYVVDIAKKNGIADGLSPLQGGVSAHLACHARAQNMGPKAIEMLKLIPETEIATIERCSGHGGSWGVKTENFELALKVGKPVARQAVKNAKAYLASECPLAAEHIRQGTERLEAPAARSWHPIELLAKAYGLI